MNILVKVMLQHRVSVTCVDKIGRVRLNLKRKNEFELTFLNRHHFILQVSTDFLRLFRICLTRQGAKSIKSMIRDELRYILPPSEVTLKRQIFLFISTYKSYYILHLDTKSDF
jgi:hypothetical protein